MKTNIKATGLELTPALRAYLEEKLTHVERFIDPGDQSVIANVELGKPSQHHQSGEVFKAEINLHISGGDLYASTEESDLYAAIDIMKDEIISVIKTRKDKQNTLLRRGGRRIKGMLRSINPWRKH